MNSTDLNSNHGAADYAPEALGLDLAGIEKKVEEFKEKYKIAPLYRDLSHLELAKIINADVKTENFAEKELSSVKGILISSKETEIYLPDYGYDENEKRFTVAHEIGHFFLHKKTEGTMVAAHFGNGPVEDEASSFAGALLMPKVDLVDAYKILRRVDMVAAYFKVPLEAAKARIKSLKIDLSFIE